MSGTLPISQAIRIERPPLSLAPAGIHASGMGRATNTFFDAVDRSHGRSYSPVAGRTYTPAAEGPITLGGAYSPIANRTYSQVAEGPIVSSAVVARPRQTRIVEVEKIVQIPQILEVEKVVPRLQTQCRESIVEVPQSLIYEKAVEVPDVRRAEIITQKANIQYQDVPKSVQVPRYEAIERVQEITQTLTQEVIQEVPQVQCVELIREVPKATRQKVAKRVPKPVVQVRERTVQIPSVTVREEIVQVPQVETVELIKEVPLPQVERVQKEVVKYETHLVESVVEVPQVDCVEVPVEVPDIEVREVIKQVPKYMVQYVDKKVDKYVVEYVEKIVDVPQIIYEERIVEVPQWEQREIVRHTPKPVVKYVDKQVPRHENRYHERQIKVDTVLHEERPVEVPEIVQVEAITEVPVPQHKQVQKAIPQYRLQPRDAFVEMPIALIEERAIEVPEVKAVDVLTEVASVQEKIVEKAVPCVHVQPIEKNMEILVSLQREVVVPVPQQQVVESIREQLQPCVTKVQKEVPRSNRVVQDINFPLAPLLANTPPVPRPVGVAMVTCHNCGAALQSDSKFCGKCGARRPLASVSPVGSLRASLGVTAAPKIISPTDSVRAPLPTMPGGSSLQLSAASPAGIKTEVLPSNMAGLLFGSLPSAVQAPTPLQATKSQPLHPLGGGLRYDLAFPSPPQSFPASIAPAPFTSPAHSLPASIAPAPFSSPAHSLPASVAPVASLAMFPSLGGRPGNVLSAEMRGSISNPALLQKRDSSRLDLVSGASHEFKESGSIYMPISNVYASLQAREPRSRSGSPSRSFTAQNLISPEGSFPMQGMASPTAGTGRSLEVPASIQISGSMPSAQPFNSMVMPPVSGQSIPSGSYQMPQSGLVGSMSPKVGMRPSSMSRSSAQPHQFGPRTAAWANPPRADVPIDSLHSSQFGSLGSAKFSSPTIAGQQRASQSACAPLGGLMSQPRKTTQIMC